MAKPANTGDPTRRAELIAAGECLSDTHDGPKATKGSTGRYMPRPAPSSVQGTFDPGGLTRGGPTIGSPYCETCGAYLAAAGMFAPNKATAPVLVAARQRLGV